MACNGPEVEGGRGWKLHVDELIRHWVRASHVKTVASSLSIYPWLYALLSLSLSLSAQDNAQFFAYTLDRDGRGSERSEGEERRRREWAGCSRPRAALMSN